MKTISISKGNIKLGNIPQFNLPPKKSCPNCKHCFGVLDGHRYGCYAMKAYTCYPSAKNAWDENLRQCKRGLKTVQSQLDAFLSQNKPRFMRIHSAGDFYSQAYLDMWIELCRKHKTTRFLAFTKSFHLDFSRCPKNLKIVYSIMPTTPIETVPAGSKAYAGNKPDIRQRVFECPGSCDGCGLCWNLKKNENVHFNLH